MVIEEVNVIQQSLEIERTCRESAEALASKVHASCPRRRSAARPCHLFSLFYTAQYHRLRIRLSGLYNL
ncbi:Shootin-1 [Liparis tanakae]|uniref:Shootin-1 n=1 Tax=Liparis tanakae TaxID=230148 RepID=A0A4Z2EKQ4_9TELE|nr:Shootin-1 [Liparis tanakae]